MKSLLPAFLGLALAAGPSAAASPDLLWSTYLGSGGGTATAVVVNPRGDIWLTGTTVSDDFPVVNGVHVPDRYGYLVEDGFVSRFSPDGRLVQSTYVGDRSNAEFPKVLSLAPGGGVVLSGHQILTDDEVALLAERLTTAGGAPVNVLGEYGEGWIEGAEMDRAGNLFTAGYTCFPNFPLKQGVLDYNICDSFVVKWSPGGAVLWVTFLADDYGVAAEVTDMVLDAAGNVWVAGEQEPDAFLARLDPAGRLVFSTAIGGAGQDRASSLAVDRQGNIWITGFTSSDDFPLLHPLQDRRGGGLDAFIAGFSRRGDLIVSTYYGGSGDDQGVDLAVGPSGQMAVTGSTASADLPLVRPLRESCEPSCQDAFLAVLDRSGTGLLRSTYLGGGNGDRGTGVAFDAQGNIVIVGDTASTDFPLRDPWQARPGSIFVAKVRRASPARPAPGR